MNKISMLSLLAVASMASSTAAFAGPSDIWAGPYAGVSVGRTSFKETWSSDEDFSGNLSSGAKVGPNFSLIFGSNVQRKNVVVGFEADFGTARGTAAFAPDHSGEKYESNDDAVSGRLKSLGHLRARFGYAVGSFLPYVGFGLASATVEHSVSYTGNSGSPDRETNILLGTSMALGVEYAVTPAVKVRGEFVSDKFGSASVQSGYVASNSFNAKLSASTLKVGATYTF